MEIATESREFLIRLLTNLRRDLRRGAEGEAAHRLDIVDGLLQGLEQSALLPDDAKARRFVIELANKRDLENEYDRVVLEHQALAELGEALARRT